MRSLAPVLAQLLICDARGVHTPIDAIQPRTRPTRVIAIASVRREGALLGWIARVPAGTGIHRRHEREARGIRGRRARARDRDRPFLERFAQRLEDRGRELRELVEEQRASVREAHLSGPRWRATTDE